VGLIIVRITGSPAGHDVLRQPCAHNGECTGKLTSALDGFWGEVPMRLYRISFLAGAAAGFVAGTRAGRERYDQMVKFVKQAREHPAVQQATSTATNQASSLLSTAGQKVADTAPKFASTAMQKAGDHIPLLKRGDGHGTAAGNGGETGKDRGAYSATGASNQGQPKTSQGQSRSNQDQPGSNQGPSKGNQGPPKS
jgi:hypothetical protein